mmetsp:Transcript_1388/g.2102  ORF Transcript_1388/g.2102 Transcript_1388/m.2102 type:complete len:304 (-) Transcript_1388:303-1214(-)
MLWLCLLSSMLTMPSRPSSQHVPIRTELYRGRGSTFCSLCWNSAWPFLIAFISLFLCIRIMLHLAPAPVPVPVPIPVSVTNFTPSKKHQPILQSHNPPPFPSRPINICVCGSCLPKHPLSLPLPLPPRYTQVVLLPLLNPLPLSTKGLPPPQVSLLSLLQPLQPHSAHRSVPLLLLRALFRLPRYHTPLPPAPLLYRLHITLSPFLLPPYRHFRLPPHFRVLFSHPQPPIKPSYLLRLGPTHPQIPLNNINLIPRFHHPPPPPPFHPHTHVHSPPPPPKNSAHPWAPHQAPPCPPTLWAHQIR